MKDRKLEGLKLADEYWRRSYFSSKLEKWEMAQRLHEYAMFSLNQLGKCVRMQAVELTRNGMRANSSGGRFEPETLTTLIAMRQMKLAGERIPPRLIEVAVKGGTSWSCAAKLTEIPYSNYYKFVPEKDTREVNELRVKQWEKEAIVKAMNAKADSHLLAEQYGVTERYVRKILQDANS